MAVWWCRFAALCGQSFLPSLPVETPAEPMGRVLTPSNPNDLRRIRTIIAYMGSTLDVSHVMQVVEIIDPARLAAVRAVQQVRAKQLAAMKDAITSADEYLESKAKRPLAHEFAMACATANGAQQGNPLLLFHGTRALRPADVVCSGGPSMDHSADAAFYGRGIYASTSAAYVQRAYAHRLDDRACLLSGVRQMLAVVGVAGNTYNARTRKRLSWDSVRAGVPSVAATSATPETKLDVHSVSGYLDSSCSSRNFAFFYDTDVAPAYLITYRAREVAAPPARPAPSAARPFFLCVPGHGGYAPSPVWASRLSPPAQHAAPGSPAWPGSGPSSGSSGVARAAAAPTSAAGTFAALPHVGQPSPAANQHQQQASAAQRCHLGL